MYIYQMRSGMGEDPNEILTRLTHQVWQTFDKRQGQNTLDPHLWPEIFTLSASPSKTVYRLILCVGTARLVCRPCVFSADVNRTPIPRSKKFTCLKPAGPSRNF